ncbi:hypothetical protein ACH4MU_25215 [Streptomyces albidoflavus]|uniref:hypothetical protein n=1 Tax=Streptomyces TaxID=1883 RepID=UPI00055B80A6|nr:MULTISPECIES: hypothetical protein [Streptomyces]RZE17908.1 hypothetical protein C0Q93_20510 [Streptomyces albidoflavus]RZE37994.1 hypothetical protein C0Q94_20525 [Streptomyces albidoflavus]
MTTRNQQAIAPSTAVESLRTSLAAAGIVLPSLAVDTASPHLGLVELGRVRADVAAQLAEALRDGGRA